MNREFNFTDLDFNRIRHLVSKHTGIYLTDSKRDLVYSRLAKRLRQLGLHSFKDYTRLLENDAGDELINFTNAITTNLTSFFREAHHFDYLADTHLPRLVANKTREKKLRIWSAGCSTGEEAYSLAIIVRECIPDAQGWDIKILATDIDSHVLEKAFNGLYEMDRLANVSPDRQQRWFEHQKGLNKGMVKVAPELKSLITFKKLNLLQEWPMKGPFDIIFCRNVIIYFDKEVQKSLFERYANILSPEGVLFLGHAESMYRLCNRFELIDRTVYRKCP